MEDLPYEALRELWGTYVLPNGIRIKARPSVAYVFREPEAEDVSLRFETDVVVAAPEDHQGDPEDNDNPDEGVVREIFEDFERHQLPRSFYLVDDKDLLVVKAYPNRILWYDSFHDNGQPVIEVNHTLAVNALEGAAAPLEEPPEPTD